MAKVRNEIEQKAYDLLYEIPAIECDTVITRPYYSDNRTAKVRICEINGELWVPLVDLSYGTPRLAQIHNLRKTGNLTDNDLLPLRTGSRLCWFIRKSAIERCQSNLEKIINWDLGIELLRAVIDTLSNEHTKASKSITFSKEELDNIHRNYEERVRLEAENREQKRQQREQFKEAEDERQSKQFTMDDAKDAYMKKLFSATEEEMQEAMSAMEDIDELAGRIVGLCMDWVKHTGNKGGDWGNGLVMGLTKATSYLLIALDRQGKKEKGKPSIIEFYQAMLPVCLDIAKNDIEQKEAIEREKKAKEGYN